MQCYSHSMKIELCKKYPQEPEPAYLMAVVHKELGELDSWKRSEFLEKGGWDKMPGQKEASYGVARACTDGVELLIKK